MPTNPSVPGPRVRYGKLVNIEKQVILRRKRLKNFHDKKAKILDLLLKSGMKPDEVRSFMLAPREDLLGKTPKSCLNPTNINGLYRVIRKFVVNSLKTL